MTAKTKKIKKDSKKIYTDKVKTKITNLYLKTRESTKGKTKKQISKIWQKYNDKKVKIITKRKEQIKPFIIVDKLKELKSGFYESFKLSHFKNLLKNETLINDFFKWSISKYKHKNYIRYVMCIITYSDGNVEFFESKDSLIFSDVITPYGIELALKENKNIFNDFILTKILRRPIKSGFDIDNVLKIEFKIILNESVKTIIQTTPKKSKK